MDAVPHINKAAPSIDENEVVVKLRGGKAAGICNIIADLHQLLKAGGEAMIRGLLFLIAVWYPRTIPPGWKRGLVVHIWKGKVDRLKCNNYREITLLSVPGKVLSHLLLVRVRSHLLKYQRPEQSRFKPGMSTTDYILVLLILMERRREFRQGMLAIHVDLKIHCIARHSGWGGGGVSSFLPVHTGVRQGCVLAPSLFNTCLDWVLGRIVDQSHCGASVGNTKITDFFADDAVIFAESLEVLVLVLETLYEKTKLLGF